MDASEVLSFRFGPLMLRPRLELSERYDNNIFYQRINPIGDFRTDLMPGLYLSLGQAERVNLTLSYQLDQARYTDRTDLDSLGHSLNAQIQFLGARLSVLGTDRWQVLENQVLGQELSFQNLHNRIGYSTQSDNYRVAYRISEKFSVYVQGTHDAYDYSRGSYVLDYDNLSGTLGFQKAVRSKTILFGEMYYGQTATAPNIVGVPQSPHSDFVGGYAGVEGSFTEKVVGQVKAGFESRSFSGGGQGADGPVVGSSVSYRISEKRSLTLIYNRRSNVSVQNGNVSYVTSAFNLQGQQQLGTEGKWVVRGSGGYGLYEFQGNSVANRTDTVYSFTANLDYNIQLWLKVGLGYEFNKYDSRTKGGTASGVSSYEGQRFSVRLSVGY